MRCIAPHGSCMDRAAGGNVLQHGVGGRYDKKARRDEAVKKARDEMEKQSQRLEKLKKECSWEEAEQHLADMEKKLKSSLVQSTVNVCITLLIVPGRFCCGFAFEKLLWNRRHCRPD